MIFVVLSQSTKSTHLYVLYTCDSTRRYSKYFNRIKIGLQVISGLVFSAEHFGCGEPHIHIIRLEMSPGEREIALMRLTN